MSENQYSTNVGDFLIIWITGCLSSYIAKVTSSEPLRMKVTESGPFANLKEGDFIIREEDTAQFQKDCREETCVFLEKELKAGRTVGSGLKDCGVKDGELRKILPDTQNSSNRKKGGWWWKSVGK
jgi:hypothetical protein